MIDRDPVLAISINVYVLSGITRDQLDRTNTAVDDRAWLILISNIRGLLDAKY